MEHVSRPVIVPCGQRSTAGAKPLTYFLTFHGKLVYMVPHDGALILVQCPVDATNLAAELVSVDVPVERFRAGFDDYLADRQPVLDGTLMVRRLGACQIAHAHNPRSVSLTWRGRRLCALDDGRVADDVSAPDWEGFLPISDTELAMLRTMLANDWVVRSSGELVRAADVAMGAWYTLRIGPLELDLRYQLPFDDAQFPFRLTVLKEGWRIEQFCLYRPLIYFTAFRSPVIFRQCDIAIRSLLEFGEYDGHILLITDQPADALPAALPALPPDRFRTCHVIAADGAGFLAARFKIVDFPWAAQFQPVMFMDCDVVFDAPVAPMLCAMARSDQISAPLEPFSPMRSSPAAGSGLLQLEGLAPGFAVGMNFGTVGIPNIPAHAATLRLIRRIMMDHALLHGRTVLPYHDQEVANYVAFRLTSFGPAIHPFVRYGGWPNTEPAIDGRVGLVHFWPALRGEDKLVAMQRYHARIDAASKPP